MPDELPYDSSSRESIVAYAERLVGRTLREALDELPDEIDFRSHKGGFGNALERGYFKYEPNSRPEPDFAEAGIELKATPLKRVGRGLVAKERLVLGKIDYMTIVSEEWENSAFLKKNSHLLLVFYLHEKGKDPRDFEVKVVRMWDIPEADLEFIRRDWETIAAKVAAGEAHMLSESDTLLLSACTKAATSADRTRQPNSPEPAKPRAYAFKASYVNTIISGGVKQEYFTSAAERRDERTFEELVHGRFEPYLGMTADEIAVRLGVTVKRGAKNFYAVLTRRILGVGERSKIAEFEKSGINVRTVRLLPGGRPKEAISFKAFDYLDLVTQDWETSDLRADLARRFFFVIYQLDSGGVPTLVRTQFWTMPAGDVEHHARRCFEQTVEMVMEGRADYLPKSSDNRVCHVRPHGRDSKDTLPLPGGGCAVRKSFWLNQSYVAEVLQETADS